MAFPTLQIYSAIGFNPQTQTGLSAAAFGAQLAQAEASGEKRVAVRINSGGGDWTEGQSMYDMLKASALKVDTYCVGLVASAATLPFMAGNKRLMAKHGKLMIHNCGSTVSGQVEHLELAIEQQKAINDSMAQLYAAASGQTPEKCAELMQATTYLGAEQALALGFATAIIDDNPSATPPPASLPTASLHTYYATLLSAADMKNLLVPIFAAAGMLTLTAASSDADVATAVQAAFTDRDKYKKEADDAKAATTAATTALSAATAAQAAAEKKVSDMEEEDAKAQAAAATAAVTALVDGAISSGRITASLKDTYTTLATADLASTKAVLEAIPARKSLTASILDVSTSDTKLTPLTAGGAMLEVQARLASK